MNRIEITVKSLALNLFSRDLIRGALLCGGNMKDYNCMTIGWGTMGILWHKSVFIVYVRPNRHTFNYLEKIHSFTINFFDPVFLSISHLSINIFHFRCKSLPSVEPSSSIECNCACTSSKSTRDLGYMK